MIYYDVTKMGAARHKSGLMRVSAQLLGALGRVAQAERAELIALFHRIYKLPEPPLSGH